MTKSTESGRGAPQRRNTRSINSKARANKRAASAATDIAPSSPTRAVTLTEAGQASRGSRFSRFFKTSFLVRVAATALASAGATLLYKKLNQTSDDHEEQGLPDDVSNSGVAVTGGTEEVTSRGPVRKRKKRSDAGVKRGPRAKKSTTSTPVSPQVMPEVESTGTSAVPLIANTDASTEHRDSRSELEAEAHPS